MNKASRQWLSAAKISQVRRARERNLFIYIGLDIGGRREEDS